MPTFSRRSSCGCRCPCRRRGIPALPSCWKDAPVNLWVRSRRPRDCSVEPAGQWSHPAADLRPRWGPCCSYPAWSSPAASDPASVPPCCEGSPWRSSFRSERPTCRQRPRPLTQIRRRRPWPLTHFPPCWPYWFEPRRVGSTARNPVWRLLI